MKKFTKADLIQRLKNEEGKAWLRLQRERYEMLKLNYERRELQYHEACRIIDNDEFIKILRAEWHTLFVILDDLQIPDNDELHKEAFEYVEMFSSYCKH